MKKSTGAGIALAILAAALYAINSPFSKLLLDYMPSTLMAGFLYIGAGLGMGGVALFRKLNKKEEREEMKGLINKVLRRVWVHKSQKKKRISKHSDR